MANHSDRRNSRELRAASLRLREIANVQTRLSLRLREGAAAAIAKAVIMKTVFVASGRGTTRMQPPPLDHLFFSQDFTPADRDELLLQGLQCAKRVAGTTLATIQLRGEDGALRIQAHAGVSAAFVRFFDGMSGPEYLHENGQLFIADVASDALLAGTGSGAVLADAGIRSIACTPIVHDSKVVIGLLSAYYREPTAKSAANLPGQRLVALRIADWLQPEAIES